jgi:tetratricopeptide (TPR) repeat protein
VAKTKQSDEDDKLKRDRGDVPGAKGPIPVHVGGETIVERLAPHAKKIAIAAGLIAVILIAVFGYQWWRDRNRGKATKRLAQAMEVLRREVKPPGPGPEPKPEPGVRVEPTFPTHRARAEAGLAALAAGGGDLVGDVYRGGLLLDAGKLDEAEAAYRRASGRADLDGILAREGLGFVAEERAHATTDAGARQKHLEAALAAFRSVQTDDKGALRDHALYHEARILALLDKRSEAVAALEKALEVAPETKLAPAINERLAELEAEK